jgi:very-short-patch-repair endonuclease
MKSRARRLRYEAPVPERVLWSLLRNRRLSGLKFRRQQAVGPFVADYFYEEAKLVVELDGLSHMGLEDRDRARDAYFRLRGLEVVRVSNDELLKKREEVAGIILEASARRKPSPRPSPEGRGRTKPSP